MSVPNPHRLSTGTAVDDPAPGGLDREVPPWEKGDGGPLVVTYGFTQPPPAQKVFQILDRYRLQTIARDVLCMRAHHRIGVCKRAIVVGEGAVKVGMTRGRASYGGLMVCGSPWVCAVCADRITRERAKEVVTVMGRHMGAGKAVFHVPFTIPHRANQPLKELIGKIGEARRIMANRPSWKRFKNVVGLIGYVRGLEVTWGENGWHPHLHDAWFLSKRFDDGSIVNLHRMVLDMWQSACEAAGLEKPNYRGVMVTSVRDPTSYVAKWGIQAEMTRGHMKRGRAGRYSPFDLLRGIHEGEKHLTRKFLEYADAFHRRRQLVWSKGLRELYRMEPEKADDEIAESMDDGWGFLYFIAPSQWKVILAEDKRAEVLRITEREGEEGAMAYIRELCGMREPGCEG